MQRYISSVFVHVNEERMILQMVEYGCGHKLIEKRSKFWIGICQQIVWSDEVQSTICIYKTQVFHMMSICYIWQEQGLFKTNHLWKFDMPQKACSWLMTLSPFCDLAVVTLPWKTLLSPHCLTVQYIIHTMSKIYRASEGRALTVASGVSKANFLLHQECNPSH